MAEDWRAVGPALVSRRTAGNRRLGVRLALMTTAILAVAMLASAGVGMAVARVLVALDRRLSIPAVLLVAAAYTLALLWQPASSWASNALVLLGGGCAGFALGLLLGSPASVLAFLTTAAVVDLVSFSDGLTRQIVEAYRSGGSTALRFLATFVTVDGREHAVVGLGDIAILAAAYVGFSRAAGSDREPATWLLAGLLAAFIAGVWLNGAPGIPFIAAAGWGYAVVHARRGGSDGAGLEGGEGQRG
jgi:hypothetical protein